MELNNWVQGRHHYNFHLTWNSFQDEPKHTGLWHATVSGKATCISVSLSTVSLYLAVNGTIRGEGEAATKAQACEIAAEQALEYLTANYQ